MFRRNLLSYISNKRYILVKIAIVAVIASFIAVFSFHTSRSSGVSTVHTEKKLSYISVTIKHDDSLWSIAKKYEKSYDGSCNELIDEIKRCNGLSSDRIYAGNSIVVPVVIYSEKISKLPEK